MMPLRNENDVLEFLSVLLAEGTKSMTAACLKTAYVAEGKEPPND